MLNFIGYRKMMRAYLEFDRESLIYCEGSTLSNPLQPMGEASCQPLAYHEIFNSTLFSEWLLLSTPLQVYLWRLKLGHRLTGYLKCGIKLYCRNKNRIGLDVNKKILWCTFFRISPQSKRHRHFPCNSLTLPLSDVLYYWSILEGISQKW